MIVHSEQRKVTHRSKPKLVPCSRRGKILDDLLVKLGSGAGLLPSVVHVAARWVLGKALDLAGAGDSKLITVPCGGRLLQKVTGTRDCPTIVEMQQIISQSLGCVVGTLDFIPGSRMNCLLIPREAALKARRTSEQQSPTIWFKLRMYWRHELQEAEQRAERPVEVAPETSKPSYLRLVTTTSSVSECAPERQPEDPWEWLSSETGVRYHQGRNGVLFCEHSPKKKADRDKEFGGNVYDMRAADLTTSACSYVPELLAIMQAHVDGSVPLDPGDKFILLNMHHGMEWQNWVQKGLNEEDGVIEWASRFKQSLDCIKRHGSLMKIIRKRRKQLKKQGIDLGIAVAQKRSAFFNDVALEHQRLHGDVILLEQDALRIKGDLDQEIVEKLKVKHNLPLVKFQVK